MKSLLCLIALLLSVNSFAADDDLDPKTHMLELESYPNEFLANTAKEICKGKEYKAQGRADKICYAYGHISAVKNGFVTADNVELDYMMRYKYPGDPDSGTPRNVPPSNDNILILEEQ